MDKEIKDLKETVAEQAKQLITLRKAIDILTMRLSDTDKRARRNSESIRRSGNDINNIKRKLRG